MSPIQLECRRSSLEEHYYMFNHSPVHADRANEKSVPFLRSLRDMLLENSDIISFSPGCKSPKRKDLGRIIVHDRHQLEERILPHYFNHSSFASLRRQLNYFNFVRHGKGRQRESTYTNKAVFTLDDILNLRRRTNHSLSHLSYHSMLDNTNSKHRLDNVGLLLGSCSETKNAKSILKRRQKLRASGQKTSEITVSLNQTESDSNIVSDNSEDEQLDDQHNMLLLDLTKPEQNADDDVVQGCRALLKLGSLEWM